ncbi:MAG: hypothetical protein ACRCYU_18500, partial [Nocardioides sp.]
QEKAAEAFAVWFLMPRRIVQNALGVLQLDRPTSPMDVYRLSTVLGTSYATTLRHLPNLRMTTARDAAQWARTPPGRLKARMDRGVDAPHDRRHDVLVAEAGHASTTLYVESGDRIVLPGVSPDAVTAPTWLTTVGMTTGAAFADGVVLQVAQLDEPATGYLAVDGASAWDAQISAGPQPAGRQPGSSA